jgi:hypothetical protein
VTSAWRFVVEFAKDALATEWLSNAGKVNALGLALTFAVIALDGTLDLIEAAVKIVRPSYSVGTPPLTVLIVLLAVFTLLCMIGVGVLDPLRRRDREE